MRLLRIINYPHFLFLFFIGDDIMNSDDDEILLPCSVCNYKNCCENQCERNDYMELEMK